MSKKSLEKILIKFSDAMVDAQENECVDEIYDKAIQSITNYYLAKLPQERDFRGNGCEWNDAIAEMRKTIGESYRE